MSDLTQRMLTVLRRYVAVDEHIGTTDNLLHRDAKALIAEAAPLFPNVYCSQCGQSFGPGNTGYSHCSDHAQQLEVTS